MPTVVGLGECLFDVYRNGARRLGGATLNFAVHAQQIQSRIAGRGVPVTRIGNDALGREMLASLETFSIDTIFVQRDDIRPSGQVLVTFAKDGAPNYEILEGVAWDAIAFDDAARELAQQCDAVCFGTLAQRAPASRAAIQAFIRAAPQALRLCDINLRQQYFDAALIRSSLELANAAKLNGEELEIVSRLLGLGGAAEDLLRCFELEYLILTRGELGTAIYSRDTAVEGERVSYPEAADRDAVGAGDACAAAAVVGLLLRQPLKQVANFANHVGAYVASQPGGTPPLPEQLRIDSDCTFRFGGGTLV